MMNKHYEIIANINDKEILLNVLSNFEDEDFNGNNGIQYCKDETLDNNFTSDKDYIVDKLKNSNFDTDKIISEYFYYWLGNYFYHYDLIKINNKKAVLYLIWEY